MLEGPVDLLYARLSVVKQLVGGASDCSRAAVPEAHDVADIDGGQKLSHRFHGNLRGFALQVLVPLCFGDRRLGSRSPSAARPGG